MLTRVGYYTGVVDILDGTNSVHAASGYLSHLAPFQYKFAPCCGQIAYTETVKVWGDGMLLQLRFLGAAQGLIGSGYQNEKEVEWKSANGSVDTSLWSNRSRRRGVERLNILNLGERLDLVHLKQI